MVAADRRDAVEGRGRGLGLNSDARSPGHPWTKINTADACKALPVGCETPTHPVRRSAGVL